MNAKVGKRFTNKFTQDAVFEITLVNEKRDIMKYKVIENGRIGQINSELLQDFEYMCSNNEITFLN